MAFSACVDNGTIVTSIPTRVVVTFTPTSTITFIPPTLTPQPLPEPGDLITPEALLPNLTDNEQSLLNQAVTDLQNQTAVSRESIQALQMQTVVWEDALDCDDAESMLIDRGIVGYRIWLLVSDRVYEYHTNQESVRMCDQMEALATPPEVLILIDPVAADLVTLAQRRVGQELDISTRRVHILQLEPRTWADASLGCPVAGQTYAPATANGYLIVLQAAGNSYEFHSSFSHVILCNVSSVP